MWISWVTGNGRGLKIRVRTGLDREDFWDDMEIIRNTHLAWINA